MILDWELCCCSVQNGDRGWVGSELFECLGAENILLSLERLLWLSWWVLVPLSISLTRCLSVIMVIGWTLIGVLHSLAERGL